MSRVVRNYTNGSSEEVAGKCARRRIYPGQRVNEAASHDTG